MTAHYDPVDLFRKPASPSENDLKRWVGKITLWCATRTPWVDDADEEDETEDGVRVVGEDLVDHLLQLPTTVLADFRATQGRDPTPAELLHRYQTELGRAGYYWDIHQENPEPLDPDDETTVLVSFDDGGLDRLAAYTEHGITIGDWLTWITVYAEDDDCRRWGWTSRNDNDDDEDADPGIGPNPDADAAGQEPSGSPSEEVWEAVLPPRTKARPYPGRPTHWPHRRARRTRARRRNNHKGGSR
ncbi:MAG: hypothetical protein J0I14_01235 [Propionibacteriaceae bacterium]|jgi:hypothetical protein|nr:hypothetical protein [Propionibacteriaceae bacterium]